MSKKTFNLIEKITIGVEAIAGGLVAFFNPSCEVALEAAIPIIGGAVISVCKLFVKEEEKTA